MNVYRWNAVSLVWYLIGWEVTLNTLNFEIRTSVWWWKPDEVYSVLKHFSINWQRDILHMYLSTVQWVPDNFNFVGYSLFNSLMKNLWIWFWLPFIFKFNTSMSFAFEAFYEYALLEFPLCNRYSRNSIERIMYNFFLNILHRMPFLKIIEALSPYSSFLAIV